MNSATDAFEDAEIAREELLEAARAAIEEGAYNTLPLVQALANALEARQSPASATAADAWDEGVYAVTSNAWVDWADEMPDNPYRVAAPEGDGGNE